MLVKGNGFCVVVLWMIFESRLDFIGLDELGVLGFIKILFVVSVWYFIFEALRIW